MSANEVIDATRKTKLEKVLQRAHVPTLPMVAQKVVQLCSDENADFTDFTRVIEADPGLSARLLRSVNSAYYGLADKATSVERAVSALGLKQVKSICLGFHLTAALNRSASEGFDMGRFWQASVLRGVLARLLADRYCPEKREEAFLIGLLQDGGVPLLAQGLGKHYAALWHPSSYSPSAIYRLENETFDYTHLNAAEVITQRWELPELLAVPICRHHQMAEMEPRSEPLTQLCQISYFVGTLALNNPDKLCEEDLTLPTFCREVFGMDQSDLQELLQTAQTEFRNMAVVFADVLNENLNVSEILLEARDLLVELEADKHREMIDLESEVKHLQNACLHLTQTVEEITQKAESDELTGLATRSVLEKHVDEVCHRVQHGECTLSLLFIDVDDFKQFNDKFCHAVGDRVLVCAANLLRAVFPHHSCLARYGGDEFIVAMLGQKRREALALTRTLLQRLRKLAIPVRQDVAVQALEITCSVGMVHCEAGSAPGNIQRLQELADQKMYEAKHRGKNNVVMHVLPAQ